MKRNGISLITLVITLAVVVILAAAVILTISNNNPINSAKVAAVAQTRDSIASAISSYLSKMNVKTRGEYSSTSILLGNTDETDKYKVVDGDRCLIEENSEEKILYKLDNNTASEKLGVKLKKFGNNSHWYIDDKGKVYLIYDTKDTVERYLKQDDEILPSVSMYVNYSRQVILGSYTVTFDANGGTCETSSKVVEFNKEYGLLPIPENSGKEFLGWKDSNGNLITAETIVTIAENHTLYAEWPKVLTLDANGGRIDGTSTKMISVAPGTTISMPTVTVPTSANYKNYTGTITFDDWYTEPTGGEKIQDTTIMPDTDQTWYAHYTPEIIDLHYSFKYAWDSSYYKTEINRTVGEASYDITYTMSVYNSGFDMGVRFTYISFEDIDTNKNFYLSYTATKYGNGNFSTSPSGLHDTANKCVRTVSPGVMYTYFNYTPGTWKVGNGGILDLDIIFNGNGSNYVRSAKFRAQNTKDNPTIVYRFICDRIYK